jgi:hypothetical protein
LDTTEHPQPSGNSKQDDRAEALKTAIAPEAFVTFAAGQVRVLDLETIRASLGPRWQRLSTQVHMLVETVLRRVIGPADLFVQVDESEYLIAFPHANEQQASAITSMAAEQIRQKLFGQNPAFRNVRVASMVQMVRINAADAAGDPLGALQSALAAKKQPSVPPSAGRPAGAAPGQAAAGKPAAGQPVDVDSAIANSLNDLMERGPAASGQWANQPAAATTERDLGFAGGGQQAIPITRAEPVAAPTMVPISNQRAAAQPTAPDARPAPEIGGVELIYRPVWDPTRQAVNSCHLSVQVLVDGRRVELSDFAAEYDSPKIIWAVNSLLLRRFVAGVQAMQAAGRKTVIFFPVSRQFIDTESGLRFLLDQLQLVPDGVRALLIPEVTDAYFGSWPALAPKISVIRRVCRALCVRLSLDHKDFSAVASAGASLVSGHLADHDWPERQALAAMNEFAELAGKASLKTVVDGLDTSSLVIAAVSAGVNLLCGGAIGNGEDMPPAGRPLSLEEFYLSKFAGSGPA